MKPIPDDPTFVARFRANIALAVSPGGCRLWVGTPGDDSYGVFTWQGPDGKRWKYRAHRLALALHEPPTEDGLYALHHCDTPLCCETGDDHLYWGTAADNARDRDRPYRRWQLRNRRVQSNGQLGLFVPTPDMFDVDISR